MLVGLRVCAAFAGCLPWDEIPTKNHTRPRPLPSSPVLLQLRTSGHPACSDAVCGAACTMRWESWDYGVGCVYAGGDSGGRTTETHN